MAKQRAKARQRRFSGALFTFRKLLPTWREAQDYAQDLRGKNKHARVVRRRQGGHAVFSHRGRLR